jgi:hypothetical protein
MLSITFQKKFKLSTLASMVHNNLVFTHYNFCQLIPTVSPVFPTASHLQMGNDSLYFHALLTAATSWNDFS